MALPTQNILDGAGVSRTVNTLNSGRQLAVDSSSTVLSTEDKAALDQLHTDLLAPTPAGTNAIGTVDLTFRYASNQPVANTIATGGTAQVLFNANSARRGITIQNQSSNRLWFGSTAAMDQTCIRIEPGEIYETVINHSGTALIQIIGPVTGQAFYAAER